MRARIERGASSLGALATVAAGGALLWLICGVGFANYDTLYALAWGGQLARGETPAYEVAIAPTPHPLIEALGVVLAPLPPQAVEDVTVALGFLALAGCAWLLYRLASLWFGRAAGVVAALILLTRVPILSYGVRAYVDIPYLLFVLAAVLVEARARAREGRPAGAPVLALLALAGLLRPEAWAFSGLYWLYLAIDTRRARGSLDEPRSVCALIGLALLAASAPLIWILSDLAITGDPLWSLTNTRHTAHTLDRITGIGHVPEYVPRRIGEILRPPVLVGAALGGVLSLMWLRRRALTAVGVGLLAALLFILVGAAGLPINTRYAFLTSAILCVFCGAGVFGWTRLEASDPRRRWWMAGGALVLVALLAFTPSQYKGAHREMRKLARQEAIQNDLIALVKDGAVNLRCGPVGVPNHAPVPLLALYLETSPANVKSAQVGSISAGQYLDPASKEAEEDYVLDPHDPHRPVSVPPGFLEAHANHTWLVFQRCS
ncbi:MAG TPA: glycosyltransferase family 39 protein [Solirubrobacteraceae bacterium]|nr:glycosyltransferase family 39 protein [Solirubrobacteraceae bacterium]